MKDIMWFILGVAVLAGVVLTIMIDVIKGVY
jgi:hypothetical protein